MENVKDIIIIGAGPVGLYGAFYSGIRDMSCKILDSLPELGGQLITLYPKKYIYDVPGFPKVYAEDLAKQLIEQSAQFNPEVVLNEKIVSLEYHPEDETIFKLTGETGNIHLSKSVLIAAGAGAFMPKKLDVQGIKELEGKGFYYFVKDPELFTGKEIIIIGGGDSALDWALNLSKKAKKVTLIHRSEKFRAHEDSINKLYESTVEVLTFHELKALYGEDRVEKVIIFDSRNNDEKEIKIDAVLCNLGFITNLGPIKEWGFDIDKNSIKVKQTMNTNLEGVWAAGDIAKYMGKLKLISTGFAEAAIAVNMAKNYIDPKARVFPGHSSSKKNTFSV